MSENIDKLIRRTYRYFYDDGLVEMAIGLLFTAVGLFLLTWRSIQAGSIAGAALALAMVALVTGGAFLIKKIVQETKARVTYPRTGYVAYRRGEPPGNRWPVVLAAVLFILASLLLPQVLSQMPVVEGALLAIILGYLGLRSDVRRFYAVAAAALVLGTVATLLEAGDIVGSTIVFTGTGVVLFITGILTFITYLRQHPREDDTGN